MTFQDRSSVASAGTTTDRAGASESLAFKAPVKCATTANITLSGAQTIDDISVVADDRVLVKEQTDATENGIYIASASSWRRAPDWDGAKDIVSGTLVNVISGTVNGDQIFEVTTADPITIGSTSVTITGRGFAPTLPLTVGQGGTGGTTQATGRTGLGLGTIATQDADNVTITGGDITADTVTTADVTITGGDITGITDLAIADGGTGASTAADAFTAIKQAASDTDTGVVEIATQTEVNAGSDTTRVITPATLAGRAKFRAHKNGSSQTATSATTVTVTWPTEDFDIGSFFASNAWTPPAGYVFLHFQAQLDNTNAVDAEAISARIFKNGVELKTFLTRRSGVQSQCSSVTIIDLANGTDAYDARVLKSGAGNGSIDGTVTATYFLGFML